MLKYVLAFLVTTLFGIVAYAQGPGATFPTPANQQVGGVAVLVPCGPQVSGQYAVCPPGPVNPLSVVVTNASSPTGVIPSSSHIVTATVASTDVFQILLAQSNGRTGCTFYNISAHTEYVSVDATLSGVSRTATGQMWIPVVAGGQWSCQVNYGGVVRTDAVLITGTAGDPVSGDWQGS